MLLLKLELKLRTKALLGSYEPSKVDPLMPLRPQTIKGVWRWWARAYVAGVLFDKGCLKGERGKEVTRVSRLVGREMGLGFADPRGNESVASWYVVDVEPREKRYTNTKERDKSLQRIRLLTIKRDRGIEHILPGSSFLCSLYARPSSPAGRGEREEAVKAAIGSLLTSIILSCYGKGGRRGLGCFDVSIVGGEYSSDYRYVQQVGNPEQVKKLINDTRRYVSKLVGDGCGEATPGLPYLPSISPRVVPGGGLRVFSLYHLRGAFRDLLGDLHNFFLRAQRQRRLGGDPLRDHHQAWVLGLPRSQRGTGYRVEGEGRRASPFLLSIKGGGGTAYLSVFVSSDWPKKIKWVGRKKIELRVEERLLLEAYKLALDTFMDYVGRLGIKWESVWP